MFIMYNYGKALYFLKDIDNNGTPELFVGIKDSYGNNTIYGMFAFKNGRVINMDSNIGERAYLDILSSNEIYIYGSSGAAFATYETYTYYDGVLTLNSRFELDSFVYYFNGSYVAEGNAQLIKSGFESKIIDLSSLWKSADNFSNEKPVTPISVTINGQKLSFSVDPYIDNGVTMVPMRTIFESLGTEVLYDAENQEICAVKDNILIVADIGYSTMYKVFMNVNMSGFSLDDISNAMQSEGGIVDATEINLDRVPVIVNGSTFVPLRAVAEALDCQVSWDSDSKTAAITY